MTGVAFVFDLQIKYPGIRLQYKEVYHNVNTKHYDYFRYFNLTVTVWFVFYVLYIYNKLFLIIYYNFLIL